MKIKHAALKRALTQLGVTEHPAGSNDGPEIKQYRDTVAKGLPPGPWCMYFCHWCFAPWRYLGGWGSVENFERWAVSKGMEIVRPRKGDIVCFDWDSNGWADHVGIVKRVLALRWSARDFVGWVEFVEGNTSPTAAGSQSNGGMVCVKRRWVQRSARFARVPGDVQ